MTLRAKTSSSESVVVTGEKTSNSKPHPGLLLSNLAKLVLAY